jgi:hypothetical protein
MQLSNAVRRVLRAKPTHLLGIAVCAFALAAVVVSSLAGPTSRPPAPHTFRAPIGLLPAIIPPRGPLISQICSSMAHQPHGAPRCP